MSTPNPRLVTSGTTTTLPPFDFSTVPGGTTSTVLTFDILNDGAAADDVTNGSLYVMESDDNGVTWNQTGDLTTQRWAQFRLVGVDGTGIENQTTPWTPSGAGARLFVNPIPANCRRQCELEVVVPPGVTTASKKIKICFDWRVSSTPLSQGFREGGIHGIYGGTGDRGQSFLIFGDDIEESGTPDNNAQLLDVTIWKYRGVPYVSYPVALPFAASAAGKARWILIYGGTSIGSVASSEVTAPAPVSDRDALAGPNGDEVPLVWIHRDDGTISNADISYPESTSYHPFGYGVNSGLDIGVGPGRAVVDNRLLVCNETRDATLAASVENIVYLLPTGGVEIATAGTDPSDDRAEAIWSLTTDGSSVISERDLRRFIGAERFDFESFFPGTVTTASAGYWTVPQGRTAYVLLPEGMTMQTANLGDRTTGNLEGELEYWDGAAWQSAFSDAARRPLIAHGAVAAATPYTVTGFIPDTVAFPAGTMLRHRIAAITATGGTADPKDVRLRTPLELVSE